MLNLSLPNSNVGLIDDKTMSRDWYLFFDLLLKDYLKLQSDFAAYVAAHP